MPSAVMPSTPPSLTTSACSGLAGAACSALVAVTPSACEAVGEGCASRLQRQRSVCKVFSVGQLVPSGLRHRCCRRLRHGFRRNRRGIRRTKRFLQHQLQHVRRQHASFLPPCKLGRRWWRGGATGAWAASLGASALPGKGSSRLKNGRRLRTDQWRLRSQKGRRYRIGHRQDFGGRAKGASAKTPAPDGAGAFLTARQAPTTTGEAFGQEPEEPPCARRIIRPRHWHGRWSHVGQRYVGQKRWWGAGMTRFGRIKHLGAVTAAHPAIRNAQLVRDHLELGRTGGAACDLAHLQWIVERRPHSPRGLARLNGWRSSKSSRLPNRPLCSGSHGA